MELLCKLHEKRIAFIARMKKTQSL